MEIQIEKAKIKKLIKQARLAKKRAYCSYSKFKVGAAVLTSKGKIYVGCNIENSSYGLSVCAERVAIFNAIANGERKIVALCLVNDSPEWISPCGACRQVIYEFGKDVLVIMCNRKGKVKKEVISSLLPDAFILKKSKN